MKTLKILSDRKCEKLNEIINILLGNRGIKSAKDKQEFLNPDLSKVTSENSGINATSINKALKRIDKAIKGKEKIIVYGDYDVDGICGTAILWETLFDIYKNVMPHIPHRVEEGYGLSIKGIDHVISEFNDVKLIITVDNGIVANDAVEYANKLGVDVVITDHHVANTALPKAFSIVHTTQLCGAAVAYLLAKEISNFLSRDKAGKSQISNKFKIHNTKYLIQDAHLELVALATVADLVPLTGNNRAFVKFGIESLRRTSRVGLIALFDDAAIKKEEIDVYKIGHVIAPRLNASGRIAHAMDSLRLICTKDLARAKKLALHLSTVNRERQVMTENSTIQADSIKVDTTIQKMIFVHNKDLNPGIIGLVASRLVEKHYLPSIVVAVGEQHSKGSARSIKGVNIIEFIRTFQTHLVDAGGHPMAAGFTIETARIEEFKTAVLAHAAKTILPSLLKRVQNVDMELMLSSINSNLYEEIRKLEPFGMSVPEPVFISRGVTIQDARLVGRDRTHLKVKVAQDGFVFDGIFFKGGDAGIKVGDKVDIVYSLEIDTWNGNARIQLKIKDVQNAL